MMLPEGVTAAELVDEILLNLAAESMPRLQPQYQQGEAWWHRRGLYHCARGFDFHQMGLQHGPESAFAKSRKGQPSKNASGNTEA